MIEVREVLRVWLDGHGLRRVAELAGVDRKTVRRYVEAAQGAGLVRERGAGQLDDALIGAVVEAVRPARPAGHGAAWAACVAEHEQIAAWVDQGLSTVKIGDLLARKGVVVPYRTLARYAVERCGAGRQSATVRVADGEPGVECQLDFARMGLIADPVAGRRRVAHALIFTAVYSRHTFVHVTFTQTLEAVIAGCEAAWEFFGGVFKVVVPDNLSPVVADADPVNPTFTVGWLEYSQARGFSPTRPGSAHRGTSRGWNGSCSTCAATSLPGEDFVDLADAQARAVLWCSGTAGLRVHGTTQQRPAEVFAVAEAPLLLPAPTERYDVPLYATAKVHRDHHIEVGKALYSLPGHLIGQRVQVRADAALVKVFHRGQLIKTHPRLDPGRRATDRADYPADKVGYAMRDLDALLAQADAHGPSVGAYAARLLDVELPWTRMRTVYRLLGLARRYGGEEVDAACAKTLAIDVVDVRRVARILETAREHDAGDQARVVVPAATRFARSPAEFTAGTAPGGSS